MQHAPTPIIHNMTPEQVLINRYRVFICPLVCLTAGAPPSRQLIVAIEEDKVNLKAVAHLLAGFPFDSYTEDPAPMTM